MMHEIYKDENAVINGTEVGLTGGIAAASVPPMCSPSLFLCIQYPTRWLDAKISKCVLYFSKFADEGGNLFDLLVWHPVWAIWNISCTFKSCLTRVGMLPLKSASSIPMTQASLKMVFDWWAKKISRVICIHCPTASTAEFSTSSLSLWYGIGLQWKLCTWTWQNTGGFFFDLDNLLQNFLWGFHHFTGCLHVFSRSETSLFWIMALSFFPASTQTQRGPDHPHYCSCSLSLSLCWWLWIILGIECTIPSCEKTWTSVEDPINEENLSNTSCIEEYNLRTSIICERIDFLIHTVRDVNGFLVNASCLFKVPVVNPLVMAVKFEQGQAQRGIGIYD